MTAIISIEGNIGSGKSTFIRKLKEENILKDIIYLEEPVDIWNNIKDKNGETILQKFYNNQEKYSFSFQIMAYISRLSQLKRTLKKYPNKTIITERSILTDKNVFAKMLFDDNKIEDVNYKIYLKWFEEFMNDFNFKGFIYLKTLPKNCNIRIKKRNRKGEETIPISYSKKCDLYHDNWLNNIGNNKIILNGNIDFTTNIPDEWYNKIKELINE